MMFEEYTRPNLQFIGSYDTAAALFLCSMADAFWL